MRTRVKICGITRAEDARAAAMAGADAIGLVFYDQSPRYVSIEQAREVCRALPPFVAVTALFLDAAAATVQTVIDALRPDILQFHGNEAPAFCQAFGVSYIRAVPMGGDADPAEWAERFPDAAALLLDSHRAGEAGGRGETFDWQRGVLPDGPAVIAAGGLQPDNVGAAVRDMRPYGVDVSSGVEIAPGIKDHQLMQQFIEAIYRVDRD